MGQMGPHHGAWSQGSSGNLIRMQSGIIGQQSDYDYGVKIVIARMELAT